MQLQVTASTITVRCPCGEEIEFDDIHDGWQHIYPCDMCGERVSVQIDDPIAQTLPANWPGSVPA